MGIVKSILDTDLYKLSMSYVYATLFPEAEAEKLLSDPCIVEIDRIPISIRERIIKLINV